MVIIPLVKMFQLRRIKPDILRRIIIPPGVDRMYQSHIDGQANQVINHKIPYQAQHSFKGKRA